jgi:hypothetical protein
MVTFIGVYRGDTVGEAKLITISADPELVQTVVSRLLDKEDEKLSTQTDSVLQSLHGGTYRALRLIKNENEQRAEGGGGSNNV